MIEELVTIVKNAGNIILEVYNDPNSDFGVEIKDDNSPLTRADTLASDYICAELKKLDPKIPIICEETGDVSYEVRKDWTTFWLVDPLDGTKEFIKKNGEFTVNIGLVYGQEPIIGVVGIPCQDKIYYAENGLGAYVFDYNAKEKREIKASEFSKDDPINVVCSRSHMNEETKKYFEQYNVANTVATGSSIKLLYCADGTAHLYPRLHPTMEWDTAAADAILREAGGRTELLDGTIMKYNKESLLNPSFVCFSKIIK
jgi:3'(2'), 5'-bisphosphate nucleotidase